MFEVFDLKNHDFTPTNHIFSNFRGPPPLDSPLWPIITLKRISHDLLYLTLDQLNFYTHKKYLYVHYYNCEIPSLNQSESRLDNGVISINLSRTFFTGLGHVLEYIDQVLKIHSF